MESIRRPIRPEEREVLDRYGRPSATLDRPEIIFHTVITTLPIWFALLFVDALYLPRVPIVEAVYIFGTLIVTLGLTYPFYRNKDMNRVRAVNARAAAVRDENRSIEMVEECRVRVVDALDLYMDEDSGSLYYLELEDGRVLVLGEMWLEREDDDDPYAPNRELIITRAPELRDGTVIAVRCVGEFFTASHRREVTAEEWETNAIPEDGEILSGPLSRYFKPAVPSQA